MTTQRVFIVDLQRPWRPIVEEDCPIISGKKFTWAQGRRHRHLLGGSAFYLKAGAKRRKLHLLQRSIMTPSLRHIAPYVYDAAWKAMRNYDRTGEL